MLDKMLTEYPPEAAEVLREVFIEAFTAERIKEVSLDIMVKYYSTNRFSNSRGSWPPRRPRLR